MTTVASALPSRPIPRSTERRVTAVLDRLADLRGLPLSITVDHGPEFEGRVLDAWAYESGMRLNFIRPGKPIENAYIESFNGRFRDECLSVNWFTSLSEAQVAIEVWRHDYNECRPHSALGRRTPAEFTRMIQAKTAKTPSSDHRLTA